MIQCKCELNIEGKNMCLYNYNKKERKYKHLTYAEKTMIERWHNKEKLSTREIAKLLDKSERTIRRELKRGKTIIKDYLWRDVEVYSADVSNREYILNLEAKGKELKIGSNLEVAERIEYKVKKERKSAEVVAYELKEEEINDYLYTKNYEYDDKDFDIKKTSYSSFLKFHFSNTLRYWQSQ